MKIGRKRLTHRLNELINHEAVCRTAPAAPSLLTIQIYFKPVQNKCDTTPLLPPLPPQREGSPLLSQFSPLREDLSQFASYLGDQAERLGDKAQKVATKAEPLLR